MTKKTTYCNTCTWYWCDGRDIGCNKGHCPKPAMHTPSDFCCKDYQDYYKAEDLFRKVLYTLKKNNVMVKKGDDGIYVRLADKDKDKGAFSTEWVKIIGYN